MTVGYATRRTGHSLVDILRGRVQDVEGISPVAGCLCVLRPWQRREWARVLVCLLRGYVQVRKRQSQVSLAGGVHLGANDRQRGQIRHPFQMRQPGIGYFCSVEAESLQFWDLRQELQT